jgi:hypothetical protein
MRDAPGRRRHTEWQDYTGVLELRNSESAVQISRRKYEAALFWVRHGFDSLSAGKKLPARPGVLVVMANRLPLSPHGPHPRKN